MKATQLLAISAIVTFAATASARSTFAELAAYGTGEAWVFGRGEIAFKMKNGTLTVQNVDENELTISTTGDQVEHDNTLVFSNVRGSVKVVGDAIATHFVGGKVLLSGKIRGHAVLSGDGTYTVDGGEEMKWNARGDLVALGETPDDTIVYADDAQYEAQTVVVVRDIVGFPGYGAWARRYPHANYVLLKSRSFHLWYSGHRVAATCLFNWDGWSVYVSQRKHLRTFLESHYRYERFVRRCPAFAACVRHPNAFARLKLSFPTAIGSIHFGVTFGDWQRLHPRAARAIRRPVVRSLARRLTARKPALHGPVFHRPATVRPPVFRPIVPARQPVSIHRHRSDRGSPSELRRTLRPRGHESPGPAVSCPSVPRQSRRAKPSPDRRRPTVSREHRGRDSKSGLSARSPERATSRATRGPSRSTRGRRR
jgi:hypothetical protein